MRLAKLTVDAGWHQRFWCPVEAELELGRSFDLKDLVLWDVAHGAAVPVQAWSKDNGKVGLVWVVAFMGPCEARSYELRVMAGGMSAMTDGVQLAEVAPGKFKVSVGGKHFATYNYGTEVVRPYLYPIFADDGIGVTRSWPMVKGVTGETNDHPHHKGMYTSQGDVNGVDNWSEGPGHGYQIHRAFATVYSGPVAGGFTEQLDWTDAHRKVNMTETRRMTFYSTPTRARLFDYGVTLHASEGEVTLGDTKEGGLLSVRVASSMDAQLENGGRIVNGYGGIQEAETWGKRAPWCDYSGPIGAQWYGICIMDHGMNPRHPTYWHVRNYGLMTANCFGRHHFTRDPENRWDLVIPAGESLTWRYRVLIHYGDAGAAKVAVHYHDFAHPPAVKAKAF